MKIAQLIATARDFWGAHGEQLLVPHPDGLDTQIVCEDRLAQIVSDITTREIEVVYVQGGMALYSQVWLYDRPTRRAVIQIDNEFEGKRCWSRFCLIKELMHVLHPDPSDDIANQTDLRLALARDSRIMIPNERENLDHERIGLYMAIETMVPWIFRGEWSDLRLQGVSNYRLALENLVPQNVVNHYFDCGYGQLSARYHKPSLLS